MPQPRDLQPHLQEQAFQEKTYWRRLLASFSIPAFRWLWGNSLFGTMRLIVVFIARGWLVLTMTGSPFWVGLAPALRGVTQIILGAFSGVLLDRINRKKLLVISEVGNSLVALGVGALVITGQIELWHIMLASVIEGIFISFRWPAINTILYETVGSEKVLNASATQLTGFNLGNIIASAIAGILIESYGIGSGYLLATGCGLISGISAFFVKGEFQPKIEIQESFKKSLQGGLKYVWTSQPLRLVLVLSFTMSLLGWSHISMMPVMARDILGVNAAGLGFLTTAGGIGAFIATLLIAGLGNYQNKIRLAIFSASITAIMTIIFAISPWYYASLAIKVILQGGIMGFEATLAAIVLMLTSDQMQGRVQGIYTLLFGFTWLGGVIMGSIATISSAPIAIGSGGVAICLAIIVLWKPLNKLANITEVAP